MEGGGGGGGGGEQDVFYRCEVLYVKIHENEHDLPWFKVYDAKGRREFTSCDKITRHMLVETLEVIESSMIKHYEGHEVKINLVSLGMVKPVLHWHVVARFPWDPYYPSLVWNAVRTDFDRDSYRSRLESLPPFESLKKTVLTRLEEMHGDNKCG